MTHTGTATQRRDRRPVALPLPAAGALLLVVLALALAACGSSSHGGTSADPATLIPASAPVYLGAEVRPNERLEDAALSDGRTLTGHDEPFAGLVGVLQTPGSPPLDYGRDVEPWLGRHAAIFLTSLHGTGAIAQVLLAGGQHLSFPFAPGGAQGAMIIDTSDASAARSFVTKAAGRAGATASSYRGVTVLATSGGDAFAIVKGFVVLGTRSAVQSVIDTSLGGPSLSSSSTYKTLERTAPSEALAHLYLAPSASGPAAGVAGEALAALTGSGAALASVTPEKGAVTVDLDVLSAPGSEGLLGAAPQGAQALGALPGESWLALGIGNPQAVLGADVGRLGSLLGSLGGEGSSGGSSSSLVSGGLGSLVKTLLSPLEVMAANTPKAHADYASWMGPTGVFASGAGLLELRAGVVIVSSDAARSTAAVGKLAAQLEGKGATVQAATIPGSEEAASVSLTGLPLPMVIASGHDSTGQPVFVLGLGESSVTEALTPSSTLAGGERATAAAHALGEGIQPSLIVDVPTLLSVLEALGLTESAGSTLTGYLRAATTVSGGARELGDGVQRVKLVVGLSSSGG
ncbi:MAG TPA: DUF3352 domain-containing protein [Solirubrobacteraceae bacterium]|nr:DUF3352 domain-containing protein [Solirubrobacteraceae bacterium]